LRGGGVALIDGRDDANIALRARIGALPLSCVADLD
jgi:hypothetical protein